MLFATSWYELEQMLALGTVETGSAETGTQAAGPRGAGIEQHSDADVDRTPFTLSSRRGVIVVAFLTVFVGALSLLGAHDGGEPTTAPPTSSVTSAPAVASALPQAHPQPAPTRSAAPSRPRITTDAAGFIDSPARCGRNETAVAVGRTDQSLVVVCRIPGGAFAYHGVRIRDGAELRLADVAKTPTGYLADNDGATYSVSAKELLVAAGGQTVNREPMIEYRAD